MTKLEGVNLILQSVGQRPFTALQTGSASLAGDAERYLDTFNREVQMQGWACNRRTQEITTSLVVADYKYAAPTGTLAIDPTDKSKKWVLLNGYLFDTEENTDVFAQNETVEVDLLVLIDFDKLPPTLAEAIARAAAFDFLVNIIKQFSGTMYANVRDRAAASMARAKNSDIDQTDVNVLDEPGIRDIKGDRNSNRWR